PTVRYSSAAASRSRISRSRMEWTFPRVSSARAASVDPTPTAAPATCSLESGGCTPAEGTASALSIAARAERRARRATASRSRMASISPARSRARISVVSISSSLRPGRYGAGRGGGHRISARDAVPLVLDRHTDGPEHDEDDEPEAHAHRRRPAVGHGEHREGRRGDHRDADRGPDALPGLHHRTGAAGVGEGDVLERQGLVGADHRALRRADEGETEQEPPLADVPTGLEEDDDDAREEADEGEEQAADDHLPSVPGHPATGPVRGVGGEDRGGDADEARLQGGLAGAVLHVQRDQHPDARHPEEVEHRDRAALGEAADGEDPEVDHRAAPGGAVV